MITTTAPAVSSPAPQHAMRVSGVRRVAAIIIATAAMFIGFAVAGSAGPAHADTIAGDTVFGTVVECGGDQLIFTSTSEANSGSYAKLWVWDPATEVWVTDHSWVGADHYAAFNVAGLTFKPGYYMVYVSYAQWNGYGWDYSGEYIDTYQQYYDYYAHEASAYCYMGNDLSVS